ncbi:cytochrome c oxidase subunit 6, mitochondrial [Candidozyma duobushaemuli]|uniref:Cytochrome c oxidase subunit 6, mitochondrial n=1 Tax=Candidozyma duobushaemuli TaxID=1231522 RepID=A0A2V1AJ88_9ASCO|nr:cytochrome c oxidase subunit 6, mitochondrial [[Candida] duobushaemulonis]PVH18387.1 cytochrome c oxidase subunit 6, mitochondrial [[Candida] duobushaemulonis]
MFSSVLRSAVRANVPRSVARTVRPSISMSPIKMTSVRMYSEHHEETFEEFTARYEKEFEEAYDLFEVQRVLNNSFSYDLKALEACRRVNDYPTAVRTFEALKHKVENKEQYQAYLDELKETRQELGIDLKEELYADEA